MFVDGTELRDHLGTLSSPILKMPSFIPRLLVPRSMALKKLTVVGLPVGGIFGLWGAFALVRVLVPRWQ